MLARDERAHLRRGVEAVADLDLRQALLDRADELVAGVADGDDDRDRHAALAGRAVAGAHGGVGRHVDVGVGQDDHVVLGAAERLHALAVLRSGLVDVARDRVEPTNETAAMSGCSRIASTATLSPCTTLKTPSGRPASFRSSRGETTRTGPSPTA
jgi:hypothetical protein